MLDRKAPDVLRGILGAQDRPRGQEQRHRGSPSLGQAFPHPGLLDARGQHQDHPRHKGDEPHEGDGLSGILGDGEDRHLPTALLLDATRGLEAQDLRIADQVLEVAGLRLDPASLSVTYQGRTVALQRREVAQPAVIVGRPREPLA